MWFLQCRRTTTSSPAPRLGPPRRPWGPSKPPGTSPRVTQSASPWYVYQYSHSLSPPETRVSAFAQDASDCQKTREQIQNQNSEFSRHRHTKTQTVSHLQVGLWKLGWSQIPDGPPNERLPEQGDPHSSLRIMRHPRNSRETDLAAITQGLLIERTGTIVLGLRLVSLTGVEEFDPEQLGKGIFKGENHNLRGQGRRHWKIPKLPVENPKGGTSYFSRL